MGSRLRGMSLSCLREVVRLSTTHELRSRTASLEMREEFSSRPSGSRGVKYSQAVRGGSNEQHPPRLLSRELYEYCLDAKNALALFGRSVQWRKRAVTRAVKPSLMTIDSSALSIIGTAFEEEGTDPDDSVRVPDRDQLLQI